MVHSEVIGIDEEYCQAVDLIVLAIPGIVGHRDERLPLSGGGFVPSSDIGDEVFHFSDKVIEVTALYDHELGLTHALV